ncbi:Protein flightless-1 [Halotydeus destructor]|nr:Protein flightless-1 [Halotydeus destructor]
MASTGVLPFVRGLDLSQNNLQDDKFPKSVSTMTSLKWIKLNNSKLDWIPDELGSLNQIEALAVAKNNLTSLHGEISAMKSLRSLNCRRNKLKNTGIPQNIFQLKELTILDLSHNQLNEVPEELEHSTNLKLLNLSYNQIDFLPNQLFVNLTNLTFLDLSDNNLDTVPPQIRRLVNLETLILNNNPLGHMRPLPALVSLHNLHLRNTRRTLKNIPPTLDVLENLVDVDLGENELARVPTFLYSLPKLKRLNLSDNLISELSPDIGDQWINLEVLNMCRNKLKQLPTSLCKLSKLKRLFLNDNQLDFEGIPSGIGKLLNLEVFSAANNQLEMIPEGIIRLGRLKKLILSNNKLITLPDAIHLLTDIISLELGGNPDLIMPPKPMEYQYLSKGSGMQYYNVDFSLNTQLRLVGAPVALNGQPAAVVKDSVARKKRLRMRAKEKENPDETNQAKVLKGMSELAKEKEKLLEKENHMMEANLKPKRWDEALEKPPLDYSEFFDPTVGQYEGLIVYEIENFVPNEVDDVIHGKFYEGDCYIVLKTTLDEKGNLDWLIFYWIGNEASLDKKACSAIHAVNLRNYLGAQCRTIREEQSDESPEFLALFPAGIEYVEGGRTASGFYAIEETEVIHRMYRLHELPNRQRQLYFETVEKTPASLDSRYSFLIDAGHKIFIWNGSKAKNTMKQKARLAAEKMNKEERKNKSNLVYCNQDDEGNEFWMYFLGSGFKDEEIPVIQDKFDPESFQPFQPRLYKVGLGMGYLELPQVDYKKLSPSILETKNVYILDCHADLFVWMGKKSARLVKAAALKLAQEIFGMLSRPPYALVTRCLESTESQLFKSKFMGWDDVIAVDFTRTAESVQRTGANLVKWMANQEVKVDLSALFMPRQPVMAHDEANQLLAEWNDDLEAIEAFVLEGRKFAKLPESEYGNFYTDDSYVFLCRYWVPLDSDTESEEEPVEDDFMCVAYFWQGRQAGNMGWLTFTFGLQKKLLSTLGDKLEVVRTHQQQENLKFLSHFKQQFMIHRGKRPVYDDSVENIQFFQVRCNSSPLTLRCIEIVRDSSLLNSGFCFLLKIPIDDAPIIYVWIGANASEDDARLTEEIAVRKFDDSYTVSLINEGEEPELFWQVLGGKKAYEEDSSFMEYTRLFRCSNDKGYFSVSEKCSDFCQDDLADDDIMILDNGTQVFIWIGTRCSDVEIKLAYKSAQVYVQNMRVKQPEKPRQLMLTFKGKESKKFTKCFHGWGKHKSVSDPRAGMPLFFDQDD